MSFSNLSQDELNRVAWVMAWVIRMAEKHGGTVCEKGRAWDWGQALCRECYGENWQDVVPETPTRDDIKRAMQWENGDIPDWVVV